MAYTIAPGAILEMQMRYQLAGQQLINVFHYKASNSSPDGALSLVVATGDFDTAVDSVMAGWQTSDVINRRIRAQWVWPTRYVYLETAALTSVGIAVPPTLSIGTSVVMKRMSDFANRRARGRVFMGGWAVAVTSVGQVLDATKTARKPFLDTAMLTPLDPGVSACNPVIWGKTAPGATYDVLTTDIDSPLRYQRRRELLRGI